MKIPDTRYELEAIGRGFSVIGGVDEVGRGCWAGPVVAACVVFPASLLQEWGSRAEKFALVRDSKTLSAKQRKQVESIIKDACIWAIGESPNTEIDKIGISKATQVAMARAINSLPTTPDYLLIDGRDQITTSIPQQAIIDGDALSVSIAAASIIAKEYRDLLMEEYATTYPGYNFSSHVGYGTKAHIESLAKLGVTPIHRLSYKPIKKFMTS